MESDCSVLIVTHLYIGARRDAAGCAMAPCATPPAPPAPRGAWSSRHETNRGPGARPGGQEDEMENVRIRSACKEDVPGILWLIQVIQIH